MNNITIGIETQDKIIARLRKAAYSIGGTLLEEDKTVHVVHDFDNDRFVIYVDDEESVILNYIIAKDPAQKTLVDEPKNDPEPPIKKPETEE